jgi:hypothetical protein
MNLLFKEELLKMSVGENNFLEDYSPTDQELFQIEKEILSVVKLTLSCGELEFSRTSQWFRDIVFRHLEKLLNSVEFTYLGHEWELNHRRVVSSVIWLNPKRGEAGQHRYLLNPKEGKTLYGKSVFVGDASAYWETYTPMDFEQALEWAKSVAVMTPA